MKLLVYTDENKKKRWFTECGAEIEPTTVSVRASMGDVTSVSEDGSSTIGKPKRILTMVFYDPDVQFVRTPPKAKP